MASTAQSKELSDQCVHGKRWDREQCIQITVQAHRYRACFIVKAGGHMRQIERDSQRALRVVQIIIAYALIARFIALAVQAY